MPLQQTTGNVTTDAYGGGVAAVPNYIEDVFSTYLYTGNDSTQTITNGIDLSTKGGMVWIKPRDLVEFHSLFDTTRGAGYYLSSSQTSAQSYGATTLTSFNSNGFSLGGATRVNAGSYNIASWTFRKQPKFFDVVTWTGDGTGTRTITHNLQGTVGCVIAKRLDTTSVWVVQHRAITNAWTAARLFLNTTDSVNAYSNFTNPTDTTIDIDSNLNNSGAQWVAYFFAHNAGGFGLTGTDNVISCGSFTTDGSGTVPAVNLGYEPQWLLWKSSSSADNWQMLDNMRGFAQTLNAYLQPNNSSAEQTANSYLIKPSATGFYSDSGTLSSSQTYIYIAIRRGPMKVPTSGTSVFGAVARSGTSAVATVTGLNFPPDAMFTQTRNINYVVNPVFDRLRGVPPFLIASQTYPEQTGDTDVFKSFNMNGVTLGNDVANNGTNRSGYDYINWFFGRAPSFFDEVCYTGTGSATTFAHNLGVVPELMIVKERDVTGAWRVYSKSIANTDYLVLNSNGVVTTGDMWNSTNPTSTVFSIGTNYSVNRPAGTFVNYLFATCPGVSKVGSYTGTGTLTTINCGFTGGARFVLIKRTDSTGNWYVWDTARGMVSGTDPSLYINDYVVEVNANSVYTTTGGFQLLASPSADVNTNGGSYIYLAIA